MDYSGAVNNTGLVPYDAYSGGGYFMEILRRLVKYFIEGLVVAIVAYYIPQRTMQLREILAIAVTAGLSFAILDTFSPSIGAATRTGAGFGIGANLVGWRLPFGI